MFDDKLVRLSCLQAGVHSDSDCHQQKHARLLFTNDLNMTVETDNTPSKGRLYSATPKEGTSSKPNKVLHQTKQT